MYSSIFLFVVLFSSASEQFKALDRRNPLVQARQSPQQNDLSYCYSENSICSQSTTLYLSCSSYDQVSNPSAFFQCICGNGYVTANTECDWCDLAFGQSIVNIEDIHTSGCNQYNSGTIAPLPSSVFAAVSSFNATYTGVIPGGANTASGSSSATSTGSGVSASTTKGSSSPTQTSSSARNTHSSSSPSSTITQILNGGSPGGTLTAAPTSTQGGVETTASTTLKAGSGTGSAQSWNTNVAVMWSVIACGLSALLLL